MSQSHSCRKEYLREWARANPEKRRASVTKYQRANREKCNAASAKWRASNLERARANGRAYVKTKRQDSFWCERRTIEARISYSSKPHRRANRLENNRKWERSENGRHSARLRESKHRRGDTGNLSLLEWNGILLSQDNQCWTCSVQFDSTNILTRPERHHVVPRRDGGQLVKENVRALCRSCNAKWRNL